MEVSRVPPEALINYSQVGGGRHAQGRDHGQEYVHTHIPFLGKSTLYAVPRQVCGTLCRVPPQPR
jgi:hypothetical protein